MEQTTQACTIQLSHATKILLSEHVGLDLAATGGVAIKVRMCERSRVLAYLHGHMLTLRGTRQCKHPVTAEQPCSGVRETCPAFTGANFLPQQLAQVPLSARTHPLG